MASANVLTLSEANFESEIKGSEVPVVVDFWAEWCGPCRMLGPILDQLADEQNGTLKVGKVNVDENPRVAGLQGIRSIPALKLFRGPLEVDQQMGALPKDALDLWLERYI